MTSEKSSYDHLGSILIAYCKPDNDDFYREISITTTSGQTYSGSLQAWDIQKCPKLVCLTTNLFKIFIDREKIESISI